MKVLFLAPQPFYQERGTPIAVERLLKALSEHGDQVDVLTYHEGGDVDYPGIKLHRTTRALFIRNIRPGFSWKKLLTNMFLGVRAFRFLTRDRYEVVHAVEEAVFIALALKLIFKTPYIYDMDSSLSEQMVESRPYLKPVAGLMRWAESLAVRNAKAVVPVCDALVQSIKPYNPEKVLLLPDVSLLEPSDAPVENLRTTFGIKRTMLMYVGNLEPYQGIDLLIESFAIARRTVEADLVVIGGDPASLARYRQKCVEYNIADRVHFAGPRPVEHLGAYLEQADILVSPRIKGTNTPMKVYSYLDSGKALLATRLATHTQVITPDVAMLAEPNPEAFAEQMCLLIADEALRERLGVAGRELIARNYTPAVFTERLNELYDWLADEIHAGRRASDGTISKVAI